MTQHTPYFVSIASYCEPGLCVQVLVSCARSLTRGPSETMHGDNLIVWVCRAIAPLSNLELAELLAPLGTRQQSCG